MVRTHILSIDIEDIYFLIGLSRIGRQVVLSVPWGGDFSLDDMIDRYCVLGTHAQFRNLPTKQIVDNPLRIVVYTIENLSGLDPLTLLLGHTCYIP